jgi:uncharacterized protein YeaO (DUF488 family)
MSCVFTRTLAGNLASTASSSTGCGLAGLKKEAVDRDEWAKDAAPSSDLRRWYGHDPERFAEFASRYRCGLTAPPAAATVARLRQVAAHHRLVLLTATATSSARGRRCYTPSSSTRASSRRCWSAGSVSTCRHRSAST